MHFREQEKENMKFGVYVLMPNSILEMLEYMSKSKISPTFAYVISKQLILFCFVLFASFGEILQILPEETKVSRV